jgi:hypothetical protein
MRLGTIAQLAGAVIAISPAAHAELQLVNNGKLSATEAQGKFQVAWKTCTAGAKPGAPQAALVKCVNQKIAKYQLQWGP